MTGSLKLIWIKTINKCNGLLAKPRLNSRLIDNKKKREKYFDHDERSRAV